MKKYLFAVQVFGLTAMFPVTAFLELSHGARNSSENISAVAETTKPGKSVTVLHDALNEKAATETVSFRLQTILLKNILN
ncbi:hypothetical protein [Ferruginibacter profundus]